MAKITQVIDSQLWQENLEEQIILKKFRAKKTTLSTTAEGPSKVDHTIPLISALRR